MKKLIANSQNGATLWGNSAIGLAVLPVAHNDPLAVHVGIVIPSLHHTVLLETRGNSKTMTLPVLIQSSNITTRIGYCTFQIPFNSENERIQHFQLLLLNLQRLVLQHVLRPIRLGVLRQAVGRGSGRKAEAHNEAPEQHGGGFWFQNRPPVFSFKSSAAKS